MFREDSALDREASEDEEPVYIWQTELIPMLPERLSNGICSLNQGEDRLALSCLMDIDRQQGQVVAHQIVETVICVDRAYVLIQMSIEYSERIQIRMQRIRYEKLVPMFFLMKELSEKLRRSQDITEVLSTLIFRRVRSYLNEAGKAIDVKPYEANVATRIIEDFMLMANETVAQEYCTERNSVCIPYP